MKTKFYFNNFYNKQNYKVLSVKWVDLVKTKLAYFSESLITQNINYWNLNYGNVTKQW